MKNKISFALLIAIAIACLYITGCRRHYINGDLDGQWRVNSVENVATGETSYPEDTFYCIMLHTVNLRGGRSGGGTGNMVYDYPTLALDFPYTTAGRLASYGISGTTVVFTIRELNSSHAVFESDESIITLTKF